jgi:hypothetical protein
MARMRAAGPFSVDLEAFPFVRLSSPSASAYESVDVASFFVCAELAAARERPFVLLHDARGMPYVDEQRQASFLDELRRCRPIIARRTIAYAAVASSPLERGLITALTWSAKLPIPLRIFSGEFEARTFLLERYQQHQAASSTPSR